MKTKVIGIFVCMLLIAVSISSVTGTIDENDTINMKNDDYNNLMKQVAEKGYILDDDWVQQNKLLASDGAAYNHFGSSVSIDGDYAIIGAYRDDDNGNFSGSAYIFIRSGSSWTQQAKFLASDGQAGDEFGYSVSIDGDYAIVGARYEDYNGEDSGSAYIFLRTGSAWTHQAKLTGLNGEADDEFGCSVSINGDCAIVGSRYDDDNGVDSGSAYMFTRYGSVWIHEAKLLASDGQAGDEFGCSVSIDGDYAIIGAYLEDGSAVDSGSAYIFIRSGSTWTEQAKLLALDGVTYDYFGRSVSIDGDYAIVGAYGDDDNGDRAGSAYIFTRSGSTWTEQAKLLASDGALIDYFGLSVSIDGDYAIIGAYHDDDNGDWSGSAYVFTRSGSTWTEQSKLTASDGETGDEFGCSVSIDGDYAIIGASFDNDNGVSSGSAYIYIKGLKPDLDCGGSLSWTDVTPGDTVSGSITVENVGDIDSLLDWQIDSYPDWGTWSFNPESGTNLLAGETSTIDVEVVAPDEPETEFTGEVVIVNCNDPSDTCTISVSLATPVSQFQSNQQIPRFMQSIIERYPILRQVLGL